MRSTDIARPQPTPRLTGVWLVALSLLSAAGRSAEPAVVAVRAARVVPVVGDPIENGVILIESGRVKALGADVAVPEGAEVIDAAGRSVYPGLVWPWVALGVSPAAGGTRPASNPKYKTADELYPHQDIYKQAARTGYTTFGLTCESRPPGVVGQAALARTVAGDAESMLLSDRGPLVIEFRANTETIEALRNALDAGKGGGGEALVKLAVQGEVPTLVSTSAADLPQLWKLLEPYKEMQSALIVSGQELLQLVEQLGKRKASVIVPAAIQYEPFTRNRVNTVRLLDEAGAKVACLPASAPWDGDAVRFGLAELVRAGLDPKAALRSVTINPAEMLGLDYRLGSLEVGKDANLLIADGDLLEVKTRISRVLIEGTTVYDAAWGGLR
jgi:hypothetical protein